MAPGAAEAAALILGAAAPPCGAVDFPAAGGVGVRFAPAGDAAAERSRAASARHARREFAFDAVLPPAAGQRVVYEELRPLVCTALEGHSVAVLAYGQTGSGKTHTMQGDGVEQGLYQRAFAELFAGANATRARGGPALHLTAEVVEVYNEVIRDLLAPPRPQSPPQRLEVVHDPLTGLCELPGATRRDVSTPEALDAVLRQGLAGRATSATTLNETSSRSHLVLRVEVRAEEADTATLAWRARLAFVDMAGSERTSRSDATGERMTEARNINRSLSALGDVIEALVQKRRHVPYRNSKLTTLLQDCMQADSNTAMVVAVSPAPRDAQETVCSLQFAARARRIELSSLHGAGVKELRVALAKARGAAKAAHDKGRAAASRELDDLRRQNEELRATLDTLSPEGASHPLATLESPPRFKSVAQAARATATLSLSPLAANRLREDVRSKGRVIQQLRAKLKRVERAQQQQSGASEGAPAYSSGSLSHRQPLSPMSRTSPMRTPGSPASVHRSPLREHASSTGKPPLPRSGSGTPRRSPSVRSLMPTLDLTRLQSPPPTSPPAMSSARGGSLTSWSAPQENGLDFRSARAGGQEAEDSFHTPRGTQAEGLDAEDDLSLAESVDTAQVQVAVSAVRRQEVPSTSRQASPPPEPRAAPAAMPTPRRHSFEAASRSRSGGVRGRRAAAVMEALRSDAFASEAAAAAGTGAALATFQREGEAAAAMGGAELAAFAEAAGRALAVALSRLPAGVAPPGPLARCRVLAIAGHSLGGGAPHARLDASSLGLSAQSWRTALEGFDPKLGSALGRLCGCVNYSHSRVSAVALGRARRLASAHAAGNEALAREAALRPPAACRMLLAKWLAARYGWLSEGPRGPHAGDGPLEWGAAVAAAVPPREQRSLLDDDENDDLAASFQAGGLAFLGQDAAGSAGEAPLLGERCPSGAPSGCDEAAAVILGGFYEGLGAPVSAAADAPDALCSQHVAALERGMFAVAMRAASELKSLSERRAATAEQAVALLAALGAAERLLASALEAIASEALLPEARRAALRAASPGVAVAKVATRRQRSLTKLRGVLHAAERAKGARTRQQRATEAELAARTMAAPDAAEALALAHRLRQG